jgi:hypothetical protein
MVHDRRSSISKLRVIKKLVSVLKIKVPVFREMMSAVAIVKMVIMIARGSNL